MIPEFIDFVQKLFPNIDPYTKEQAKRAMQQFEGISQPVLSQERDSFDLWQGDIFSEIPFFFSDETGQLKIIKRKALLLSNTCDASRDKFLLFAAIHPLAEFRENPSMVDNIVRNQKYSAFYLPDRLLKDDFVDFELISTISREVFLSLCQTGKVNRIASLTLVGYYMFICKMTVFFLRPEDVDVNDSRWIPEEP